MNSLKTKRILEENIQALKTNDGISVQKFGVKAVSLNKYSTLFNWIPNGYVISSNLVLKIANDEINLEEQMILKNHFNFLIKHSDTLILRSSSSLEWVNGNSFAGLFKTIGSINSFDYFLESLKVAFFHSNSKEIKNYADLKSTVLPKNHIGFILQEEIKVINSALLILDNKTHYIEFFDGDIKQAVSGNISPVFTLLSKEQQIVKQEGVLPKINIIQEIILIIEKARELLKTNQSVHLEIGFTETNAFVLQINELKNQTVDSYIVDNRTSIFMSKVDSMKWFHKVGLFQNNLKIYLPSSKKVLYNNIIDEFDFKKPVTLRFSYKNKINLPRGFFKNKSELSTWLKDTEISEKWETIVHEYINVRRSFELLLGNDYLLLEQIPGMWESDNILNPDVIYLDTEKVKTWTWNKKRVNLKFADSNSFKKYEVPIAENTLVDWQLKLSSHIEILRKKFKSKLPLNFHFVENDKEAWSFLNIRKGFEIIKTIPKDNKNHVVSTLSDLEKWDKKKHLHLKISGQRGYEQKLLEIIKRLPENTPENILVDFGLLSHPAMILREFGFKLIPSYFADEINEIGSNYTFKSFDIKDDPIKRIMQEKSIYEDDDFKVVYDINPIVENHLLIVSKHSYTSMADNENLEKKYTKLFKELKNRNIINDFILVERGRAKFCTSGFTHSHAHAHLLPIESFKNNAVDLFNIKINSKKESHLNFATDKIKESNNEYLMLIKGTEIYYQILSENYSLEKQFIRTHFSNLIK